MSRTTNSSTTRARHKKWLKRAKGYRGRRSKIFKLAKEAVLKAGQYSYRDRRKKKSTMRQRWQIKINAAVRPHEITYSRFIAGLKAANIELDRKVLAQMAEQQPELFSQIVEQVKGSSKKSAAIEK